MGLCSRQCILGICFPNTKNTSVLIIKAEETNNWCTTTTTPVHVQVDESNLLVWQGLLVPDSAPYNKVTNLPADRRKKKSNFWTLAFLYAIPNISAFLRVALFGVWLQSQFTSEQKVFVLGSDLVSPWIRIMSLIGFQICIIYHADSDF